MPTLDAYSIISVVLIDDHAMVREGLRAILEREHRIEVIGEASDGRQGIDLVGELKPDVAIVDIGMPNLNGVEATRQLTRQHPGVAVVALSMHTDRRFVMAMFEAGAKGYVAKDSISDEIVRAIQAVRIGRKYISSDVASQVIDAPPQQDKSSDKEHSDPLPLAPREREVLQLLAEGMTSAEIASHLHLSVHTVDTHRRNIMKKTDTRSVAELTKLAIREGLTQL